jgi:hypothetical protein
MLCATQNPAQRRYRVRFILCMVFYVIFILGAAWTFVHLHPTGAVAYALGVLPAVPIILFLVVMGLYLAEERDDFLRNVQIQSLLGGIGGTLTLVSVWGLLEDFELVRRLDLFWVYPIFWVFVGLSTGAVKLRYR